MVERVCGLLFSVFRSKFEVFPSNARARATWKQPQNAIARRRRDEIDDRSLVARPSAAREAGRIAK